MSMLQSHLKRCLIMQVLMSIFHILYNYRQLRLFLYLLVLAVVSCRQLMFSYGAVPADFVQSISQVRFSLWMPKVAKQVQVHTLFIIQNRRSSTSTTRTRTKLRLVGVKPCTMFEPDHIWLTVNHSSHSNHKNQSIPHKSIRIPAKYSKRSETCPFIFGECHWSGYYIDVELESVSHKLRKDLKTLLINHFSPLQVVHQTFGMDHSDHPKMYKLVMCTKTLLGYCNWAAFVRFLELSMHLSKVEHFYSYQTVLSSLVYRISRIYRQHHLLTTIPWKLWTPDTNQNDVMAQLLFHGQLVTAHECLQRTKPVAKYGLFLDYDEFLVLNEPLDSYFEQSIRGGDPESSRRLIGSLEMDRQHVSVHWLQNSVLKHQRLNMSIIDSELEGSKFDTQGKFIVQLCLIERLSVHRVYGYSRQSVVTKGLAHSEGRILHMRFTNDLPNIESIDHVTALIVDWTRRRRVTRVLQEHMNKVNVSLVHDLCVRSQLYYDMSIWGPKKFKCSSLGNDNIDHIMTEFHAIDWKINA